MHITMAQYLRLVDRLNSNTAAVEEEISRLDGVNRLQNITIDGLEEANRELSARIKKLEINLFDGGAA